MRNLKEKKIFTNLPSAQKKRHEIKEKRKLMFRKEHEIENIIHFRKERKLGAIKNE